MDQKRKFYQRPIKFVVVGEVGSGKTTLIQKFISGKSDDLQPAYEPTSVCNGLKLVINAKIRRLCDDGSDVLLSEQDIAARLHEKKVDFLPSSPKHNSADDEKVRWHKVKVKIDKTKLKWPSEQTMPQNTISDQSSEAKEIFNEQGNLEDAPLAGGNSNKSAANNSAMCENKPPKKPPRKVAVIMKRAKTTTECSNPLICNSTQKPITLSDEPQNIEDAANIEVDVWDTRGDGRFAWCRWYACTCADAVFMCVPLSAILSSSEEYNRTMADPGEHSHSKTSKSLHKFMSDEMLSARQFATRDLHHRAPPVLLVGTKSDLCAENLNAASSIDSIGLKLATDIGCCDFVHCSALNDSNLSKVFEMAVAVSLTCNGMYRASRKQSPCPSMSVAESLTQEVFQPTYFSVHSKPPGNEIDGCVGESSAEVTVSERKTPSKPCIFFPPPPDSSPPSTRPPSSASSLSCSAISSSLESLIDPQSEHRGESLDVLDGCPNVITEHKISDTMCTETNKNVKNDVTDTSTTQNVEEKEALETVAPLPKMSRLSLSPVSATDSDRDTQSEGADILSFHPSPAPRRISYTPSPAPRRKGRIPKQKRIDSIFIKFLKT